MKNSPHPMMRRLILLLGCALVSSVVFAPIRVSAAVPLAVTLDMPNQITAAPGSGVLTLMFTGTVMVDPAWVMQGCCSDFLNNAAQTNFLTPFFASAFQTFVITGQTGTFTGLLFTVDVPAGTPLGLYAFDNMGGPTELHLQVANLSTMTTFKVDSPFSVLVTNQAVPETGSTILLLVLAAGGFALTRCAFALQTRRHG